ncbi:MAG: hypothetical protein KGY99_04235 [Phycisphaerae bacterium]|nr:hypothetical protein [Phycisphaerae bacterium]
MTEPTHTPLHDAHVAAEAKLADEAGRLMPISYGDAVGEASRVRGSAGVADCSHVGRIRIRGDGALGLLERVCTHDVAHMEDNTAADTLLLTEQAGILDAARLIRLERFWVLLTSPLCREKVLAHLQALCDEHGAKVDDQTAKTAMVRVAGSDAPRRLDAVLPFRVSGLTPGDVLFGSLMVARYIADRDDGVGLWSACVQVPGMLAGRAWRYVTAKAGDNAMAPVGLAALDVLRIEAGRCRYGHEINETIDPMTAGLDDRIDWDRDGFIGRAALEEHRRKPPPRRLGGLLCEPDAAQTIPRHGSPVRDATGREVGTVTSGTYSPALDRPIALAHVARTLEPAAELIITVGQTPLAARLTDLPSVA